MRLLTAQGHKGLLSLTLKPTSNTAFICFNVENEKSR